MNLLQLIASLAAAFAKKGAKVDTAKDKDPLRFIKEDLTANAGYKLRTVLDKYNRYAYSEDATSTNGFAIRSVEKVNNDTYRALVIVGGGVPAAVVTYKEEAVA